MYVPQAIIELFFLSTGSMLYYILFALHNILVYIPSQPDGYQPQLSIVGPLHPYGPPDWPHRVD